MAVAVAVFLVACGERDDAAPTPLASPAEYEEGLAELTPLVEQKQLQRQLRAQLPIGKAPRQVVVEQLERNYRAIGRILVAVTRKQARLAERLRRLEPPPELREAHEGYLGFAERSEARFRALAEGLVTANSADEALVEFAALSEFFADEQNQRASSNLRAALTEYGYDVPRFLAEVPREASP